MLLVLAKEVQLNVREGETAKVCNAERWLSVPCCTARMSKTIYADYLLQRFLQLPLTPILVNKGQSYVKSAIELARQQHMQVVVRIHLSEFLFGHVFEQVKKCYKANYQAQIKKCDSNNAPQFSGRTAKSTASVSSILTGGIPPLFIFLMVGATAVRFCIIGVVVT